MGGLGNVLYQLFAAYLLARQDYKVSFNTSLLQESLLTKVRGWRVHDCSYLSKLLDGSVVHTRGFDLAPLLAYLTKRYGRKNSLSSYYTLSELLSGTPSKNIFGYFQDREGLEYNTEAFSQFCADIGSKLILQVPSYENVVHVRLGDSVWAKENIEYYHSVYERLNEERVHFVSDSKDVFKELGLPRHGANNWVNVSGTTLHDLSVISSSNNMYLAPSTYSWWAAHLAKRPCRVTAPKMLVDRNGMFLNGSSHIEVL